MFITTLLILESWVLVNKLLMHQKGLTVVELLVVMTTLSILSVVFLGVISSHFTLVNRTNQLSEMTVMSQNLLRSTVENIRYGNGVRQTNQISDPNSPMGGWNTSNSTFVIIIAVPAIDSSKNYIIDPNTGSPYMNELVYYKDGSTLMRRTLANPSATGNNRVTSCPSNLAGPGCSADIKLAEYVNSMTFTLYDQDDNQTSTASETRSVGITLDMQRGSSENPIDLISNIRVTLRNRF